MALISSSYDDLVAIVSDLRKLLNSYIYVRCTLVILSVLRVWSISLVDKALC